MTGYGGDSGAPEDGEGRQPDRGESFEELCERFAALCASAVDPLEIAAALESDGFSDQAARVRYGFRDVFALAEAMYQHVPRDPAEPEPEADPWRGSVTRHLVHGLLFGLPALCYPVASSLFDGPGALIVLVVATVLSWSASQGLAYLGYLRLGLGDKAGARRVVWAGVVGLTPVLVGIVAVVGVAVRVTPVMVVFAAGQAVYLVAATVVLVGGLEWWLLGALGPAVLTSAVYLLLREPAGLRLVVWLALAVSVLLVLARALWPWPGAGRWVRWLEVRGASPYAGFGALVAGLLVFPLVGAGFSRAGLGVREVAMLATLPLSLSMGIAEWVLYWYRRRIRRLLRGTRVVADFTSAARLVLVGAVARYLVPTAGLLVLLAGVTAVVGYPPEWTDLVGYLGYLAVGAALFLALLLQALGAVRPVLLWCVGAVIAEAVLVGVAPDAPVMRVQLVIGVGLGWGLLVQAGVMLGRATRHR